MRDGYPRTVLGGRTHAAVGRAHVSDLAAGEMAFVHPSALRADTDRNVFVDPSAAISRHSHLGHWVAVYRDGPADYRAVVPFGALTQWTLESGVSGIPVNKIGHYPLPWSRGFWALADRFKVVNFWENWISERSRGPSLVLTALSWAATPIFGFPQIVTFWLVWGTANIPPMHSCLESLAARSFIRFSRPGRFRRFRNQPGAGEDKLPEYLVKGPPQPRRSLWQHNVDFWADFMSERSRMPQLITTWAFTFFALKARMAPDLVLVLNWAISQVSTVHSMFEAFRMGNSKRFTEPSSFPKPAHPDYLGSSIERDEVQKAPYVLGQGPLPVDVALSEVGRSLLKRVGVRSKDPLGGGEPIRPITTVRDVGERIGAVATSLTPATGVAAGHMTESPARVTTPPASPAVANPETRAL